MFSYFVILFPVRIEVFLIKYEGAFALSRNAQTALTVSSITRKKRKKLVFFSEGPLTSYICYIHYKFY